MYVTGIDSNLNGYRGDIDVKRASNKNKKCIY